MEDHSGPTLLTQSLTQSLTHSLRGEAGGAKACLESQILAPTFGAHSFGEMFSRGFTYIRSLVEEKRTEMRLQRGIGDGGLDL